MDSAGVTNFDSLPLEIRLRIWELSLPGPRVLQLIKASTPRSSDSNSGSTYKPNGYCVNPASYGVQHPAILSVNQESRAEALKYLTKLFGVYWNLDLDAAYFEIHDIRDVEANLMTEMYGKGLLCKFKHVVIDSLLWTWETSTYTMEFKIMYGRNFMGIKGP